MTTIFDVQARVIECTSCGAPLFGAAGERVRCQYCSTESQLVARPDDGRRAPSAADEVVRLSQLKQQEANPVAGHAYDLSGVPASVQALGAGAGARDDLDALTRLWPHVKQNAARSVDDQRGLAWVAIHSARLLSEQGKAAEARAKLETTLHLLPDAGHRQLVRAELSLEATEAGELDAAEAWLLECDAASPVLELDSAHRYARARLCLARGDVHGARALIGQERGSVPWSPTFRHRAALLHIHLLELTGNAAGAQRLWFSERAKLGEMLVDVACDERLAPQTRHPHVAQDAAAQLATLEAGRRTSSLLLGTLWRMPFVTFVLAFLTMIEGCSTGAGPLLGTTGALICPAMCAECEAPLSYQFWSTSSGGGDSSSEHVVLCDSPTIKPSGMEWSGRMAYYRDFPHLALPGGALSLSALSFVLLFPVSLPFALLLALRRRKKVTLEAASAQRRLERLSRDLGSREPAERAYRVRRRRSWIYALGWVLFSLAFSALWVIVALIAVPDPPAKTSSTGLQSMDGWRRSV